jgi:recombination protein RecA
MLYGGIPLGRIAEFSGEEGSGKTTTAIDIAANAQKMFEEDWKDEIEKYESSDKLTKEQSARLLELRERGPLKVYWIDCENTFDEEWSKTLGFDPSKAWFMSPDSQSAEEIFEMATQIIDTGEVGLCVIDSLGAMVSQQEMDKTIEDATYGGISRALTKFSKKIETVCAKTNCALIGINQVRDNLNAGYGGPTTVTPGGRCWKHSCSVRLQFRQGTPFDENFKDVKKSAENPYGHKVQIHVLKTKVCKPNRKLGFYTLTYDKGILPLNDIIDIAISNDVIHQSGAWFTFIDKDSGEVLCNEDENGDLVEIKVQGQAKLIPFLEKEENAYILDMINSYVDRFIYDK